MAGLRTLLQYTTTSATPINYDTLRVWNTNANTSENGGQCCLWTVPAGVSWFAVELWGGGGGGAGACCCFSGWPGGSGSYSRKIISGFTAGAQYTICAAGSTGCSQSFCLGCAGFPSFVAANGGAVQVCASGGTCGRTLCQFMVGCGSTIGCAQQQCGTYVGTFGLCGTTGSAKNSPMCSGTSYGFMPSAPFTFGSNRGTRDRCSGYCGGCCEGGYAHFPGGGGASATAHTSTQFCGAAGAGGLVQIFYPVITA